MVSVREYFGLEPKAGEVGIEIEMEGTDLPATPKYTGWRATEDGSLRGESMEYVTRGVIKRDKVGSVLKKLQDYLANAGAILEPSDRCGVHIHINCQELTIQQWYNFAALYLVLEEMLVHFCGEEREGNLFCLRASDAEYLITAIRRARESGRHHDLCNDALRYASINFSATDKYGSLEFRAMRATTDFAEIETWANILLRVKDQSLHFTTMPEIVEGLSAQGVINFLQTVLGPYYELLICPGMKEMTMRGVRRVQEIAYAPFVERVARAPHYGERGFIEQIFAEGNGGGGQVRRVVRANAPRVEWEEPPAQPEIVILDDDPFGEDDDHDYEDEIEIVDIDPDEQEGEF